MNYRQSFIIQKEIKEASGKFLRVWANKQLRFEIFERILKFIFKNLNWKLIYPHFSLRSSGTFVILYTAGACQNFWALFGGSFAGSWGLSRVGVGSGAV